MSEMTYEDILNRKVGDVEEPVKIPMGTWEFTIISGKIKPNTREKGPLAEALFTVKPEHALDDVSVEDLDDFRDKMESTRGYHRIAIWDRSSEWNIIRFLETAGLTLDDEDEALDKAVERARGARFVARIDHAHNEKDVENPFVNFMDVVAVAA